MQAHSQSSPAARSTLRSPGFPAASHQATQTFPGPVQQHSSASIASGIGLAHDAGNLLGALGLYCDLLSAPGVLRPEHQHYAQELRALTKRSDALLSQLLNRPQGPSLEDCNTPVSRSASPNHDAAASLREIEPLLAAIAAPCSSVVCKAPRSLRSPYLPTDVFERILVNLVRNAAQAIEMVQRRDPARITQSGNTGQIKVALATLAGNLRLTVEDNGPGMPVTTAAAFLSPSPLPAGASRGMGHRIIHDLVTSTGGTMTLKVRPGRGTTITIQWSIPAEAEAPAIPAVTARAQRRLGTSPC
jgi:signal transduction histidine kinase